MRFYLLFFVSLFLFDAYVVNAGSISGTAISDGINGGRHYSHIDWTVDYRFESDGRNFYLVATNLRMKAATNSNYGNYTKQDLGVSEWPSLDVLQLYFVLNISDGSGKTYHTDQCGLDRGHTTSKCELPPDVKGPVSSLRVLSVEESFSNTGVVMSLENIINRRQNGGISSQNSGSSGATNPLQSSGNSTGKATNVGSYASYSPTSSGGSSMTQEQVEAISNVVVTGTSVIGDWVDQARQKREMKEADRERIIKGYRTVIRENQAQAQRGDLFAIRKLVDAYAGLGQLQEAQNWCLKAIEHHNPWDKRRMGQLIDAEIKGHPRSEQLAIAAKALEWHYQAAVEGDSNAMVSVMMTYLGLGAWHNPDLLALDQYASYKLNLKRLQDCYMDKNVFPWKALKDPTKTLELADIAYRNGQIKALRIMSNYFYFKEGTSSKLVAKANKLLKDQKYEELVPVLEEGIKYYEPDMVRLLGALYYNGHGVPKDYVKAVELFTKAAMINNVDAMNSLSKIYEVGVPGVRVDKNLAADWAKRAKEVKEAQASREDIWY